jgi:hypothetical protein
LELRNGVERAVEERRRAHLQQHDELRETAGDSFQVREDAVELVGAGVGVAEAATQRRLEGLNELGREKDRAGTSLPCLSSWPPPLGSASRR